MQYLFGLWQLDQQAAVSLQKQEKDDNNGPTLEAPRGSRHADHDQQYLNSKKSDLPPQAGNNMIFFRFESQELQVTSFGLHSYNSLCELFVHWEPCNAASVFSWQ